jgi:hypothetical protein
MITSFIIPYPEFSCPASDLSAPSDWYDAENQPWSFLRRTQCTSSPAFRAGPEWLKLLLEPLATKLRWDMAKEDANQRKNAQQSIAAGDGLLVSLGKIAGVGGIALGAFFLLFRSFLTQRFVSSLSLEPGQGYRLLLLFMLFTFGVAVVGLTIWASQRAAGRKISISLLVFALLLAGLGAGLIVADMGANGVPKVRQGKLGTFVARLAPHSNNDRQLQLEGVGLPEDSKVLVQVWKNGQEVREPRGIVQRSDSGDRRYEWVMLDEDGQYVIEVQRTGEGANSQLPQQFFISVGANYVSHGSKESDVRHFPERDFGPAITHLTVPPRVAKVPGAVQGDVDNRSVSRSRLWLIQRGNGVWRIANWRTDTGRSLLMTVPSVFVGSSTAGLRIAREIQSQLADAGEVELWNEGVFALGSGTLEALMQALNRFDYAYSF